MNTPQDALTNKDQNTQEENNAPNLMKKLPTLLRILGATALIFAMYSFLVKGWQSGNDVFRYLLMLGHTAVLAAIGLASGHFLKESKGARLLLVIATISVPINFAILGSFIYSQTVAVNIGAYPHYVAWTVDSLSTALLTTGGALLVLVPIQLLGFTVLARNMSAKLTFLFLFSNAALLLPLRDPQMIGLLVLALTFFVIIYTRKFVTNQASVKTSEGTIALGLQLLPLSVLTMRSVWLYSPDPFLLAVSCVTVFFLIRQISLYLAMDSKLRHVLEGISVIPAALTALPLSLSFDNIANFPVALTIPISAITSAAMIYDISCRNQSHAGTYRQIAVSGLLLGMIFNLLFMSGIIATLSCVVVGLILLIYGNKKQQRSLFIGGAILMIIGILQQLLVLLHRFDIGSWASLATMGIIAIVLGSVIESQSANIKNRVKVWKTTIHQWEQ